MEPIAISAELLSTKKGKQCLVVDDYQHRLHRKNKLGMSWVCVKEKTHRCKGNIKTNFQYEVLKKTEHSCVPNVAEIEVKRKLDTCRKRAREETSVPVRQIFEQELSEIYQKGYDFVAKTPTYSNAKTVLCKERRKALGTTQNPKSAIDIEFPSDTLLLLNGENFLRLDFKNDQDKRVLVFGGEESRYLLENGETFFLDGTFKSCPKQFAQLYVIHVDLRSTAKETNVYPALFAFLPDKRQATYTAMFREVKRWCPKWKPSIIKSDFEAAAINSCMLEFPDSTISGCNFHFNQCLWRKIQELGLVKEYKENEDARTVCRMFSALAYLPMEHMDDAWSILWEKAFSIDKLTRFIDYFVEQWMDNPNMPIKVWNVYGQRHRTNNAAEGWNSKLNAITNRNQPNVHLLVKILKEETQKVSFKLKSRELGDPGIKRKRAYVKLDERIENILKEFGRSSNLEKCLKSLSYVTRLD